MSGRGRVRRGKEPLPPYCRIEPPRPTVLVTNPASPPPWLHDRRGHPRHLREGRMVWVKPLKWRDERPKPAAVTFDDQLAELWAAGATLSDIGLKLGGSRSVVAGKIARARARGDLRFSPRPPGPKKARVQKMKARIVKPPGLFVGARRRESASQLAAAKLSTLVDLRPGQCHYPVNDPERGGEFLFCAAPVARPGAKYCRHHAEIAERVSSSLRWSARPEPELPGTAWRQRHPDASRGN
jgi:hypothetical protein